MKKLTFSLARNERTLSNSSATASEFFSFSPAADHHSNKHTSVEKPQHFPKTEAQERVLHHQSREASGEVSIRARGAIDATIPCGEKALGAIATGAARDGPLAGLAPQQQLPEIRADRAQHCCMRPAQLLPRIPSIECHVCELDPALQ
ncbi:hypothetical protein JZ751_025983 [Albula glossodonta]|uniref:Uncharacterized protein n=1 Tax=Albula glossodonta TaxID=121402 RepID=A0A8T2NKZ6_9TELE|nr:hypothetical protein JZ751_025983 [Albula glossodonta]